MLVTPCMGVWIETYEWDKDSYTETSHPVWVCGLKLALRHLAKYVILSHPVWVCGLKLAAIGDETAVTESHPVWVCGLKHSNFLGEVSSQGHTLYGCVD